MALDLGCQTTEYYIGNGVQREFTYPFEILKTADLYVGIYNTTTNEYDEFDDWILSDSTSVVRFLDPPADGTEIVIYRLTDIDPMKAIFHPGHPVKAGDLNNNFEQLQFAIEETRCFVENSALTSDDKFWDRVGETVLSTEVWVSDDEHIATTGAVDKELGGKIDDINETIDQNNATIRSKYLEVQGEIDEINISIDKLEDDIADLGGGDVVAAVDSVNATEPLSMFDGQAIGNVTIQSREATETESGHVTRLASDAEVAVGGIGGDNAVVTAAQLRATNIALNSVSGGDGGNGGAITSILAVQDPDPAGRWLATYEGSTYDGDVSSLGVTMLKEIQGNSRNLAVSLADTTTPGVFLAPTDANVNPDNADLNVIDGGLSKIHAVTPNLVFEYYIPRNFNLLPSLP